MTRAVDSQQVAIDALEDLGRSGYIVSLCFGPCGNLGVQWSVNVLHIETGLEFEKPFGASRFGDIPMILAIEIPKMMAEVDDDN